MKWILTIFFIHSLYIFIAFCDTIEDPPDCFTKLGGVCIVKNDTCPFKNGTVKDYPRCRNKQMCPKNMFCCVPPKNMDRFQYSKKMPSCGIVGKQNQPSFRIVNGHRAKSEQFPWQVSIMCGFRGHICGGTLIHPQWILTAAHCKISCPNYRVVLGRVNLTHSSHGEIRSVEKFFLHPNFSSDTYTNDIALFKLDKPVIVNHKINPACLPNENETFDDMMCITSGFGSLKTGGSISKNLMFLPVPMVSFEKCYFNWMHYENFQTYEDLQLCAGYDAGMRDTCSADSGGPLVCMKKDKLGIYRYILAGVLSFGDDVCGKENRHAVYTKTSRYLPWLEEIIGNLF